MTVDGVDVKTFDHSQLAETVARMVRAWSEDKPDVISRMNEITGQMRSAEDRRADEIDAVACFQSFIHHRDLFALWLFRQGTGIEVDASLPGVLVSDYYNRKYDELVSRGATDSEFKALWVRAREMLQRIGPSLDEMYLRCLKVCKNQPIAEEHFRKMAMEFVECGERFKPKGKELRAYQRQRAADWIKRENGAGHTVGIDQGAIQFGDEINAERADGGYKDVESLRSALYKSKDGLGISQFANAERGRPRKADGLER